MLQIATTTHAAHLTRLHTSPLLASPRIALFPLNLPSIIERDSTVTPLSLQIPLPSRQKSSALVVSVSALTGLIEIEDEGATESRMGRARLASAAVNDQKANLLNDLGRLITAVRTVIDWVHVLTARSSLKPSNLKCGSWAGRRPAVSP